MKNVFNIICLFIIIAFTACSRENIGEEQMVSQSQSINLAFSIKSIQTRKPQLDDTGSGNFSSGDNLLLSFSNIPTSSFIQHKYIIEETQLKWADLMFANESSEITIAGCFPVPALENNKKEVISIDISAQDESADILLSPVQIHSYCTDQPINMQFEHAMHQLKINYSSADNTVSQEELHTISTICTAATQCEINLKEGRFIAPIDDKKSEYAAQVGSNISLIIVPQKSASILLKANIMGQEKEIVLPSVTSDGTALVDLKGGHRTILRYDVSKKDDQTKISFVGMDISGWEDGGIIDGEIEI